MSCEECGAELGVASRFCGHCGALASLPGAVEAMPTGTQVAPEHPVRAGPRRWLVAAAVLVVFAGGTSVTLAQRGDAGDSPEVAPSPAGGSALGTVRWRVPMHVEGWWWAPMVAAEGTVVVSQGGVLNGIDPSSGELRWRRAPGVTHPWWGTGNPVLAGGNILVVERRAAEGFLVRSIDPTTGRDRWVLEEETGHAEILAGEGGAYLRVWRQDPERPDEGGSTELVGLEPETGEVTWRRLVGAGGWPSAASDDVVVHVAQEHELDEHGAMVDNSFEAVVLDGRTGDERWRRPLGALSNEGMPGSVHPVAAASGDRVLLGDVTGTLTAYDAVTGATIWEGHQARREAIQIVDDIVLDAGEEGHIVARALDSGEILWESEDSFAGHVPAGHASDGLLVVPYGGMRLTAIDLRDGTTRWVTEAAPGRQSGTIIDGSFVTMSGSDGNPDAGWPQLHAFDLESGERRWSLALPLRSGLDVIGGPAWLASIGVGRNLSVRDPESGDTRRFPSVSGTATSAAAGPNGEVIVAWHDDQGRSMLSSVDFEEVRWTVPAPHPEPNGWTPMLGPVVTDDLAVVALDGSVLAFDLGHGRLAARTEMAATVTGLAATPQGVLVTTTDGALALLPSVAGPPVWKLALPAAAISARAVGDGTAYVAVDGREIVAVALEGGRIRWRQELDGPLSEPPVAAGDHVLAVVGQTLVALDAGSGERRWEQGFSSPFAGPPVPLGEGLRVALTDGTVLALDPDTGATTGQLILGDFIAAGPWVVDDIAYVTTAASELVAIGPVPEATATVSPLPILDQP